MDNSAYLERAGDYDVENENKSRTLLKKVALVSSAIEQHAKGTPSSILEVGCGTGLFTKRLAERFPNAAITATDAFLPMLDLARTRLSEFSNVTLAHYDAEGAGTFSRQFDIICGVDLIHHLTDPVAGLRHWRDLASVRGGLVFFESNPRNPALYLRTVNRPEEVRFKYNTPANLTEWATRAGWSNVSVEYAPIYLPNGPSAFWTALDSIENALHLCCGRFAGGMIVRGTAGHC